MIFIISHANQNLAKTIQIFYLQIVRYNTRDLQATSALAHLAEVFNVSIDFLINGNTDEKQLLHSKTQSCFNNSGP
jgi:hypothetical protein